MKVEVACIWIFICQLCTTTTSYRILVIFPHIGKSHFVNIETLLKALTAKGHEVTVISHFPQETPLAGYTDISIADGSHKSYNDININRFSGSRWEKYTTAFRIARMGRISCSKGLAHKAVQEFINSRPKFDVAIVEYFDTDCYLAIPYRLKVPIIGLSTCIVQPWTDLKLGYPSNPSYIPNMHMPFSDQMSFLERVENTILYLVHCTVFKLLIDIPGNWAARKYIGDDLPPLQEIAANASLVLANMHFSLTRPRPLVPGFIDVGGMNIGKPKELPQDIENWINESKDGVIYFSLGSMIKVHTFPEEKKQIFLRAFRRLPQRVLWKWETESLPGKPDNVMTRKWMPQFDILCHPNVKAFITHGGLLGTTEAVHCGVPLIVMPQFGDQFTNAKVVEASGGGVILDYRSLNEEVLYDALKTVLEPSFNNQVKGLSARFKDRPLPPLDTAIYWVEYVARHGGASHLKVAAVGMPFYKYLLFDVVVFIAVIIFVVSVITYLSVRAVFRKISTLFFLRKVKKN